MRQSCQYPNKGTNVQAALSSNMLHTKLLERVERQLLKARIYQLWSHGFSPRSSGVCAESWPGSGPRSDLWQTEPTSHDCGGCLTLCRATICSLQEVKKGAEGVGLQTQELKVSQWVDACKKAPQLHADASALWFVGFSPRIHQSGAAHGDRLVLCKLRGLPAASDMLASHALSGSE